MKFTICLALALVGVCVAHPAFPKKFDSEKHTFKKSTSTYSKGYRKKFEYPLKAPEDYNSYGTVSGTPQDSILPPKVAAYSTAEGETHGPIVPPPQEDSSSVSSSYMSYDGEGVDTMMPPALSSYSLVSPQSDGSDAMAALRFMVGALPADSSYSRYWADPNAEGMSPPGELPESTYLAYPADAKADTFAVPSSEPRKEKTISSYSSYA